MKKFSYNDRGSSLRSISEIEMKKRRNWDRIIYMVILWGILISLLVYIGRKTFIVSCEGELITEGFEIKFMEDVRVTQYFIQLNSLVNEGDTLFHFTPSETYDTMKVLQDNFLSDDWFEREIINNDKSVGLKNAAIKEKSRQYLIARKKLSQLEKEMFLDISNQNDIERMKNTLNELSGEISGLKQEVAYLQNYRQLLLERMKEKGNIMEKRDKMSRNLFYTAPVSGKISQINKREGEINYKSDVVMEVVDPKNVTISGYVEQQDIGSFEVGSKVRIEFPGGERSVGKVSFINYNAEALPVYLQKQNDPDLMRLRIIVEPWDEDELKKWPLHYNNIKVRVYKTKKYLDFLFNL